MNDHTTTNKILYAAGWIFGFASIVFWMGTAFAVLVSEEEGFLKQTRPWVVIYGSVSLILTASLIGIALLAYVLGW